MRKSTLLGVVAVGLAAATLLDRGLAGLFDFGYLLVTAVGVLAAVAGANYALERRGTERSAADVDPPEPRYRSAVPGEEVDAALAATGRFGKRNRLRSTAVEALVAYAGYGRSEARTAVKDGTWTDDELAAGYLAVPARTPRRAAIRGLLNRESVDRLCVRRTLAAIREVEDR